MEWTNSRKLVNVQPHPCSWATSSSASFDLDDLDDLLAGAGVVSSFLRLKEEVFLADFVSCISSAFFV